MERVKFNQAGFSKDTTILIVVLSTLVVFLVGAIFFNRDPIGTGTEYFPSEGPALLNNSQELYASLDGDRYFTALREDLGVFARTTIKQYNDGTLPNIVFAVSSPVQNEDGVYSFDGSFDANKEKVSITVKPLKYGRIQSSITGIKGTNIDANLPSNSQRNKYISSLAFDNVDYSIDYNPTSDKFSISLYVGDFKNREEAVDSLTSSVGYPIKSDEYYVVIPTSVGEGIGEE